MEQSILKTIRAMIGPSASYEVFDTDLIININVAFARLCQLGVGPEQPFKITGETETWNDFMPADELSDEVKQYLSQYMKQYELSADTVLDHIEHKVMYGTT